MGLSGRRQGEERAEGGQRLQNRGRVVEKRKAALGVAETGRAAESEWRNTNKSLLQKIKATQSSVGVQETNDRLIVDGERNEWTRAGQEDLPLDPA